MQSVVLQPTDFRQCRVVSITEALLSLILTISLLDAYFDVWQ